MRWFYHSLSFLHIPICLATHSSAHVEVDRPKDTSFVSVVSEGRYYKIKCILESETVIYHVPKKQASELVDFMALIRSLFSTGFAKGTVWASKSVAQEYCRSLVSLSRGLAIRKTHESPKLPCDEFVIGTKICAPEVVQNLKLSNSQDERCRITLEGFKDPVPELVATSYLPLLCDMSEISDQAIEESLNVEFSDCLTSPPRLTEKEKKEMFRAVVDKTKNDQYIIKCDARENAQSSTWFPLGSYRIPSQNDYQGLMDRGGFENLFLIKNEIAKGSAKANMSAALTYCSWLFLRREEMKESILKSACNNKKSSINN